MKPVYIDCFSRTNIESNFDRTTMKSLILALVCLAVTQAMHLPTMTADKTYLVKQKSIYELFWHIDQPTIYHPELYQKSRAFNLVDHVDSFSDKEAVTELLDSLKHGILPRGQIFSIMYPKIHEEAVTLFRVLYSAKDFETFYNTAVWARFNVNELMYTYALSVAIIHRPDMKHIKLPPLYEIMPHLFFNDEVLHKAYHVAMGDTGVKKTVGGIDYHTIMANYSGWYLTHDHTPQHKLTYFTEDVGLNAFYFMMQHDFPYWMNSLKYNLPKDIRGELYFYGHQQLLARYNLERLSNDMEEINYVDFDKKISIGHQSTMHYQNGLPVPHRDVDVTVPLSMYKYQQELKDLHVRISTAIDLGYVIDTHGNKVNLHTPRGLTLLGNIVQGNADSVNKVFYGHFDILARKVLGFGMEPVSKYQIVPGALEIFCTSMRDPIFYSLYKNIVSYFQRYKENIPTYTKQELLFPGVKIESVTVDKLMTFFDHFESLLNNAVSVRSHKEAQTMLIKAKQYRLNHKPFTYHISVNSDKTAKAMVRVFLGPKYDIHGHEIEFEQNYMNFLELDQWIVDLKSGMNKIERNSHESVYVIPDEMPSEQFYKKLLRAIDGIETYSYPTQVYGFPDRLLLPKGKKEGMPFKLFVCVSEVEENTTMKIESPIWGAATMDGKPLGYPLDRPFHSVLFNVPNMFIKDVLIYHKQMEELNVTV